jgi:uncharacterized protein (UPF0335 family)
MDKRILELAVEALQERKAKVEAEIESIQAELEGRIRKPKIAVPRVVKRRRRTAAQRKAQSRRMKAYWAARKSRATTKPARKPTSAKPRRGPRSAAARKAQSERMKAYWAMKRREKQGKPAA